MAFTNPDPTFGDQANRVYALYQRCADIRDATGKQAPDTRHVSLNAICMAANSATATLKLLHWAKTGGESTFTATLGLAAPEYVNLVAEDMLRSARLFLLLETQFQIEALFRNLLRGLGVAVPARFYDVVTSVIAAAGLSDPARGRRILTIPALIRNSLHANGIHHGYRATSTVEAIDGTEFRFDHGQPVQCGSWFHITTAIGASLSIVEEILKSPAIAAIDRIDDTYAAQKGANP